MLLSLLPLSVSLSPVRLTVPVCLIVPCLSHCPLSVSLSLVCLIVPVCLTVLCLSHCPLSVSLSPVCLIVPCLSHCPLSVSLSSAPPFLLQYDYAHVQRLSKKLVEGITSQIPDVIRNGDPERTYPGTHSPTHSQYNTHIAGCPARPSLPPYH